MFFKVIVGPFMILTLIYLILSIFSLTRMYMLFKGKGSYLIGLTFYLVILIHCLFRTASSCYLTYISLAFEVKQINSVVDYFSKIFVNILYIPDIFFWNAFAILFWQLLESFQKGHLSSSSHEFFEDLNPKYTIKSDFSIQCFVMIVLLASGTQIIMICLFNLDMFYVFDFVIENSVYNLIIPFVLAITEIILHIKFSGIPYRTLFDSENKSKINKRIIYWGIARSLQGIFDIIVSASKMPTYLIPKQTFFEDDDLQSLVFIVSIIAGKIVTEIIPFGIVFDRDFMTIFFHVGSTINKTGSGVFREFEVKKIEKEENYQKNIDSPLLEKEISNISNNQEHSHSIIVIKNEDELNDLEINLKKIDYNLIYFDPMIKERKRSNGLGNIRLGFLNKEHTHKVCIRRIDIPKQKFSKYILEEIMKDMNKYMNLQMSHKNYVSKFKGYYISKNFESMIFFFDYYPNGSLNSLFHNMKKDKLDTSERLGESSSFISLNENKPRQMITMSYEFKLKLMYQIASALNFIHSAENPIVHGHLHPNNILFNLKNEPIISDFGFQSLKKYCKVMIGYSNKTEYTAPEYLEEKSNIIENPRIGADIYSFGMIVWELITEMKPFKSIGKEELIKKVVIEKSRPKIPDNIPSEISQIIRACWQHEEDKRPPFSKIVTILENLI